MRIHKPLAALLLAIGGCAFVAAAAHAKTVYIASNGVNTGNCTRNAPCRSLNHAIKIGADGDEVQILDSGFFGSVVRVRKAITVSAVGVAATIGTITINAPGPAVVLRGLLLNGKGQPFNTDGIAIVSAASVHIARCEIERFPGVSSGIHIKTDDVEVFVTDTISRENSFGLFLNTSGSGAKLTIDNSRFENNRLVGIEAPFAGTVAISRVVASGNDFDGIHVGTSNMTVTSTMAANNGRHGFTQTSGKMTIESSVARGNGDSGLVVSIGVARVSNSTFTDNAIGLNHASGTLQSLGNNTVAGNGTNTSGTITALAPL